jgi:hypothetical protein
LGLEELGWPCGGGFGSSSMRSRHGIEIHIALQVEQFKWKGDIEPSSRCMQRTFQDRGLPPGGYAEDTESEDS